MNPRSETALGRRLCGRLAPCALAGAQPARRTLARASVHGCAGAERMGERAAAPHPDGWARAGEWAGGREWVRARMGERTVVPRPDGWARAGGDASGRERARTGERAAVPRPDGWA
ncbi:hypothetical protein GCM10009828_065940 [Actinoplanes couchii]